MFWKSNGATRHSREHLTEIVDAINNVGASAADLVAILEALREAGSLRAELIII